MNRMILFPMMIVAIGSLVILFGNNLLTVSHEKAHQQVNEYFHVNSTIEYDFYGLLGARVVAVGPIPPEKYDYIFTLHSMNEVFLYQFRVVYMMSSFFFLTILVFMIIMVVKKDG